MAGVALQHTKMEMFEEVRPILAQQSARSLIPQVQRENIREGARRKDHSRIRTFQKRAPGGTIWKRISPNIATKSHLSIFGGTPSEQDLQRSSSRKLFKEALQGSSSRKLFRQALQRSSSRKTFKEALQRSPSSFKKGRQRMEVLLRGGVVSSLAPSMHVSKTALAFVPVA
jgi:hypothetical protein